MSARRQAKIYARERVPLQDVIPLETPFSVEIDVCSVCNFRCGFCFQADTAEIRRSQVGLGRMDPALFAKILEDLKRFPDTVKKVRLFEFGEPLLHPRLPDFVRATRDSGVTGHVEITTNGVLLTEELNLALLEAGLSQINISVSGVTADRYWELSRHRLDMERFLDVLAHLYAHRGDCHVYIKLADDGTLSREDEETFYRLFGDRCDDIFIERLSPIWRDTDVNETLESDVGPYGQRLVDKDVCPLIFTRMVINWDGVVVACCVDWRRQYVIGDLRTDPAYDVWNGARLRDLQVRHLRGERRGLELCDGCTALSSCTIDDIDAYAGEVLARVRPDGGGTA